MVTRGTRELESIGDHIISLSEVLKSTATSKSFSISHAYFSLLTLVSDCLDKMITDVLC
jgi:hypothetical protein